MSKILIPLSSSITILAVAQVVPLDESEKRAKVELVAVDSFGHRLEHPTIAVDHLVSGKPVETVRGSPQMVLPYGEYRLRLHQSGYSPGSKLLNVVTDSVTVTVCATVAPIERHGDSTSVRGRLESFNPGTGCRLVRLLPVYCDHAPIEAEISSAGTFMMSNVKPGKYVALLLAPERVCSLNTYDVLMRDSQEIVLHDTAKDPEVGPNNFPIARQPDSMK